MECFHFLCSKDAPQEEDQVISPSRHLLLARLKIALRCFSNEFEACNRPPGKQIKFTSWRSAASNSPGQIIRLAPVCKLASKKPKVVLSFVNEVDMLGITDQMISLLCFE